MSGKSTCPNRETLQRYRRGMLPVAQASELRLHETTCPECAQALELIDENTHVDEEPTLTGRRLELQQRNSPKQPAASDGTSGTTEIRGTPVLRPPEQFDEVGRLGSYRILKLLSQGGMGLVYEAEDSQLGRRVALKVIRPEQAATPVARQRFLQEARAAAAVEHENIVTIYQVGEDNGTLYLAMQLLQGESLADRLRREGKMRLGDLIRIGRHVSLGLSAAHQHGLIHRDIKPANVFLERIPGKPLPRVKILDFGLARQAQSAATGMTQAGLVIGTPGYMAPEQARSLPLDHRCDLFSLGCILHHMASGQPPFKGDDALALLVAQTVDAVPPLSELRSDAPPELSDLVERLLAKSPDERPANADMVAEGLSMIAQKLTHDRLPAAGRTGGTRTAPAASSPPARAESARPERPAPASRMPPKTPAAATAAAEATDADVAEADWKSIDSLPAPAKTAPAAKTPTKAAPRRPQTQPPSERPQPRQPSDQATDLITACPKCAGNVRSLPDRSWCMSCGWASDEEPEAPPQEPKPFRLPFWVYLLLAGCVVIILLSVFRKEYMPSSSWLLLWWCLIEAGLGVLFYVIGHAWLLCLTLRHWKEAEVFKYVDPTTVWKYAFEFLPQTRWSMCFASWGATAFVCALVVFWVNNFSFKAKQPPAPAVVAVIAKPEEEGDGKDRDTEDYLDADEALNGNAKDPAANDSNAIDLRGVDRPDEEPRPFSTSCAVIGYIASKTDDKGNPIIDQLVLGITGEDGQMHYAGTAPVPQTPDVLKQFQQLAGQLKLRAKLLVAVPGDLKNLIAVEASANCKVNYKEQDAQRLLKNPVLQEVSFGKPPASR